VVREDSNAAVAAKSDIVFLAVRPQQMPELVGLRFRAEQTVVSFLAGTPIDQLPPSWPPPPGSSVSRPCHASACGRDRS
jgi:pyrroline-5-carboxylate reductase